MQTAIEYFDRETKAERKGVVVDRELQKILSKHGTITVDAILEEAAKPKHPLHSYFLWDDAEAANRYRKVQAYAMIMASKFVVQLVENGDRPAVQVRGSVRKLVSAFKGEGFVMRREALSDTEKRRAMVQAKKSALRSWCNSVIDIDELAPVRKAILSKLGESA